MKRAPKTSSFSRILDALSCYPGICERMTYDGEPAMKLERYLAWGERKYEFETCVEGKPCKGLDRKIVKTLPLFDRLADYSANGVNTEKKKQRQRQRQISVAFLVRLMYRWWMRKWAIT